MKFKTVAEAFNFYKDKDVKELETRAAQINNDIDSNPEADIEAYNIELKGIKEAKENMELRSATQAEAFNLITGRSFKKEEKKTFTPGEELVSSPEYRSAFYKTLMGRKLTENEQAAFNAAVEYRSDEFDASEDVAVAIPTNTLNEVIRKARTMGGLLGEARGFAMPSKISIPIGTPSTRAAWHTEGDEVESEKVSLTNVSFDGYELIKIFSISVKARRMTISAFESYLTDELTACIMETIAYSLINGSGSDEGTGIETGITWATSGTGKNNIEVAADADIEYADVVATVALLKRGYSKGAKWAMNNATLYNVFYGMVDTNKRPIFISDPKGESVGRILGFNVVVDDNIADNDVYFGNYAKYLGYNLPQGITIEVSRESSFKKGLIDYRAMAIADCKPLISEAFVKLSKASE